MKLYNSIFSFFARQVSYGFTIYLICFLASLVALVYGVIFVNFSMGLSAQSEQDLKVMILVARTIAVLGFVHATALGMLERVGLPALFKPARHINAYFRKVGEREKISNEELLAALRYLIKFPDYNMFLTIFFSVIIVIIVFTSTVIYKYSMFQLQTVVAGGIISIYLYGVLAYTVTDLTVYRFRKATFGAVIERGLQIPETYGLSIPRKILLILGYLMLAVFSLIYLILYTDISLNYLVVYFTISALLIIGLVMVYTYPIINVFYSVLAATDRLSHGEESLLVLGNNEKEVINFAALFNRSIKEFVYLRKNLEVKVKERTELLEKKNRELLENEEKFKTLTDSAQDAIIMMDNDGNVSYWNNAAETIFGYRRFEIMGKPLHEILAPRHYFELFSKKFPDFKRLGKGLLLGKTVQLAAVRKSGEEFPVEISLSAFRLEHKWNAVAILRDSTERRKTEKDLYEAKMAAEAASKAKSEFLANMSHEIRTPMNGILGFSELIKHEAGDPAIREKAEIIYRSGSGLLELINDILDLSKIEAGRMEVNYDTFDFYDLLRQTHMLHSIVAEKKGLGFKLAIDENISRYIISDQKKLQQILTNLLNNAIKFTIEGSVLLSAELLSGSDDEHIIKVSVADTGIGIPEESRELIFKSFEQSDSSTTKNFGGTGLGLAIAKSFVEILGGKIWVDSEMGSGSVFSFVFKAHTGADEEKNLFPENQAVVPDMQNLSVLVVDDNEYNRMLMKYLLQKKVKVIHALDDGDQVMSFVRDNPVDLIFLDIKMKNMDGVTTFKLLRENPEYNNIRIVAFTASVIGGKHEEMMSMGFDGYLEKPISKNSFMQLMNKMYPSGEAVIDFDDTGESKSKTAPAVIDLAESMEHLRSASLDRSGDRKKAIDILYGLIESFPEHAEPLSLILETINNFDYERARKLIDGFPV
ncbi:MAG: hypothetical protein CVV44_22045 [Spirochaetae bacterium HGW-Spirochaetae-1]|jgi:PAS domain S-box-containing protein|nr:MAG: hypothetical protein CVV44_22045 [Spirochaetae bacterium HGW-Spirochaetae-1]